MKEKTITTALFGFLSSILSILFIPVVMLVICNVIDYITGLMAAKYRDDGKISSYKSMRGIFKKISMWLLVVVGAIVDGLLKYSIASIGFEFRINFFVACVVSIWLICNELISILENISDTGVVIPGFLMPLINNIKSKAENVTEMEAKNGKDAKRD